MTGTDLIHIGQRTILPPGDLARETELYLLHKRKRLTDASRRGYKTTLDELVKFFPTNMLADFQPPFGIALLEEFLDARWGHLAPRTYNKNLAVLASFFEWQARRGRIQGDPTLTIERAKTRPVQRITFSPDQRDRIFYANPELHDQVALHLLLDYGIRKGALRGIRYRDFDRQTSTLTVFTKGEKYHTVLIPDQGIWDAIDELATEPHHFLLCKQVMRRRTLPNGREVSDAEMWIEAAIAALGRIDDPQARVQHARAVDAFAAASIALEAFVEAAGWQVRRFPAEPMGEHATHDWWYRCLHRAGIVEKGITRGARMHGCRHTAAQRILDATGNLKAAQVALGHASMSTTSDVYVDQNDSQRLDAMRAAVGSAGLDETLLRSLHGAGS